MLMADFLYNVTMLYIGNVQTSNRTEHPEAGPRHKGIQMHTFVISNSGK